MFRTIVRRLVHRFFMLFLKFLIILQNFPKYDKIKHVKNEKTDERKKKEKNSQTEKEESEQQKNEQQKQERERMGKKWRSRVMAFLLVLAVSLSGCGEVGTAIEASSTAEDVLEKYASPVKAGQTISGDSKWINSEIEGAIDAKTSVNQKDDFFTAVNRDWILDTKLSEEEPEKSIFSEIQDIMDERQSQMLKLDVENTDGLDPEVMSQNQLIHVQDLVHQMMTCAGNWETRNEQGAQPLVSYLNAIEEIQTLDEMTAYLKNQNGKNLAMDFLIPFSVEAPMKNGEVYTVMLSTQAPVALQEPYKYLQVSGDGIRYKEMTDALVNRVLGMLGYEKVQIRRILKQNYLFEAELAKNMTSSAERQTKKYLTKDRKVYNREELEKIQGNYPLLEILDTYGLGDSETFTVEQPQYVKQVGKLYTEKRLEEIKSYYMVHTILCSLELLDRDTYDMAQMLSPAEKEKKEETPDDSEEKKPAFDPETEFFLENYIENYLSGAYQEMYIGRYCTASEKQALSSMIREVAEGFRKILEDTDWMGEETRKAALEKLDYMGFHILYPDKMKDYTTLNLKESDTLVDMVASINQFEISRIDEKVNQPVDRSDWDMDLMPTTIVNAFYQPTDNSINITAGIMAGDLMFSEEFSYERNMAMLGSVAGHEITHGFDTSGYEFDKNGHYLDWWTAADKEKFQLRASRLIKYYSSLTPVPGEAGYQGQRVSGEAIADMGGVKSILRLAKEKDSFDYDEFFRSYAKLWCCKHTYGRETAYFSDEHPLGFLRTNVTLQQFDEFLETYGIEPEDGMYLEKEKRIVVW